MHDIGAVLVPSCGTRLMCQLHSTAAVVPPRAPLPGAQSTKKPFHSDMLSPNLSLRRTFDKHLFGSLSSLSYSADGSLIAISASTGRILIIDGTRYRPLLYLDFWKPAYALATAWLGTRLVFVTSRGSTALVELGSAETADTV